MQSKYNQEYEMIILSPTGSFRYSLFAEPDIGERRLNENHTQLGLAND